MSSFERFILPIEENHLLTNIGKVTGKGDMGRMASGMPSFIFSKDRGDMSFIIHTLKFSVYYPSLLLRVMLGFHHTPNPLDLRWRWEYRKYRNERLRYRGSEKSHLHF